jgi:hypothetical protein
MYLPEKTPFIGKIWNDDYRNHELCHFPIQKINVVLLLPNMVNNPQAVIDLMTLLCVSKSEHWQLGDNPRGVIYCCGIKHTNRYNVEIFAANHRLPSEAAGIFITKEQSQHDS